MEQLSHISPIVLGGQIHSPVIESQIWPGAGHTRHSGKKVIKILLKVWVTSANIWILRFFKFEIRKSKKKLDFTCFTMIRYQTCSETWNNQITFTSIWIQSKMIRSAFVTLQSSDSRFTNTLACMCITLDTIRTYWITGAYLIIFIELHRYKMERKKNHTKIKRHRRCRT